MVVADAEAAVEVADTKSHREKQKADFQVIWKSAFYIILIDIAQLELYSWGLISLIYCIK